MTKNRAYSVLLIVAFACLGQNLPAREIHVHNVQGNDDFYGFEASAVGKNGPVRTIRKALELAGPGDMIILANSGEPYRESVTLMGRKHSFSPGFAFTLEGNGATLDGSVPIPGEWWKSFGNGIFYFQPEFLGHQNLFRDGKPLRRVRIEELRKADGPVDIQLEKLQWCFVNGKIYFKPEPGFLPQDYNLACTGLRIGIALVQVTGVEINNLIVQGYQNDGISASNAANEVFLRNVTLRGNARAGLVVGGSSSVWVFDSTLGNNLYAQLLTENFSRTSIFNSDLISNTAPAWVEGAGWPASWGAGKDGGITEADANVVKGIVFRDGKQIFGGLNEPVALDEEPEEETDEVEVPVDEAELDDEAELEDEEEWSLDVPEDEEDGEDEADDEDGDGGFDFGLSDDSGEDEGDGENGDGDDFFIDF